MPEAASITEDLVRQLAEHRTRVARAVRSDGVDDHDVALNELVWHHARVEVALALDEWARHADSGYARELADVARVEANFSRAPAWGGSDSLAPYIPLGERPAGIEDLDASDEHRLLRANIRDFARREIEPYARDIHRYDLDVPESIIKAAGQLGLFGLSVPVEFGGSKESEDYVSILVITEELSRASLASGGSLITRPEILVKALLKGGTADQKRRWLPSIAAGRELAAIAVTEPDYGSDVAGVQCRATRLSDGGWEINGTKLWSTFAGRCELLMVLCRTGGSGHRGLSVFVVEKPAFSGHEFEYRSPNGGILRGRAIPTIGYRGMHTFELSFERLQVPPNSLIGGDEWLNRGFYLQMEGFAMGRIQTAGRAVGLMQAAVDEARAYAAARTVFGRPIADRQLIKAMIGTMAFRLEASRRLSYRAARLLAQGSGAMQASLAKLYAARMAELVTRDGMQIHGGTGYSDETTAARLFLDARVLTIFEGTEEVLSLRVIGKALLEEDES